MGLREDIKACYRENPNISGREILVKLGCKDTPQFWRILNNVQVGMRGLYPSRRKNRNKPKAQPKGIVHFIPPKNDQ